MTLLLEMSTFLFEKPQVLRDMQMLHVYVQKGQQNATLSIKKPFYNRPSSIAEAVLMNKSGKKTYVNRRTWFKTRFISCYSV